MNGSRPLEEASRAFAAAPGRLRWWETAAVLLIVAAGMLSCLSFHQDHQHTMIPLVAGLAVLLLGQGRKQPVGTAYLLLLLLSMRAFLQGDERYQAAEITLYDYILVIIAYAASYGMPLNFWKLFMPLTGIFIPLSACLALFVHVTTGVADGFAAGDLSINQTAFLLGACLTLNLSLLWNGITGARPPRLRLILSGFWLGLSLISLLLIGQTQSRSGLGMPLMAFLLVLLMVHGKTPLRFLDQALQRLIGDRGHQPARLLIAAITLLILLSVVAFGLVAVYSIQENQVSDLHRLYLLKCYFGSMFTGHNRIIYGMGFTMASQGLCKDIGLIKGTTHAHNIFAQVAADNGFFALVALVIVIGLMLRSIWQRRRWADQPLVLCSLALSVYCLLFLQIEGGWGKVSFLQALIGMAFASLTMPLRPDQEVTASLQAPKDHGTIRSGTVIPQKSRRP